MHQFAASRCRAPLGLAAALFVLGNATHAGQASLEESDDGVRVLFDGELFAEYRPNPDHMPVIWPIIGPSGHAMTRSYPLGPLLPGEKRDHPHHLSMWIAHQEVEGHDFWHVPEWSYGGAAVPNSGSRIVHQEYLRREANGGSADLVTRNHWVLPNGEVCLIDERTIRFAQHPAVGDEPAARSIDTTIALSAPADREAVIGDRKDGFFAVRVAGAMKVEAGLGGCFTNSEGQSNGAAWGRPAHWVDYRGPLKPEPHEAGVDTPTGGVLLMSHPAGFRGKCCWHVREYGLFAANPFAKKDFPAAAAEQGQLVISAGDSEILRFRAVFYADSPTRQEIINWFDRFARTPLISAP